MALALNRCFRDPRVTAVIIDPLAANTRAHRFYERLGFALVGPRRFGEDDCLVYRLERAGWTTRQVAIGRRTPDSTGGRRSAAGPADLRQ